TGSLCIEYRERKRITVHSYLEIFGGGLSISFHQVNLGDGAGVTIQMKSMFVRRRAGSRKNRFEKELPRQLPRRFHFPTAGETREAVAEDLRSSISAAEAEFLPCPSLDFNGVGLLYFARYHEFADRLEWIWLADQGINGVFAPTERKIHFL